ncbi:MAG: prenyltransferase, partial [Proteobacteria bacterium]|nr:prenyltransferase [Pseudomonadota bacterium]
GTLALILSGKRDHHTVRRGMAYLKDYDASKFTYQDSRFFYYAHYYAIQCMYQSGEEDFKAWYPKVLQTLLEAQEDDGSWGNYGNRGSVYSTGMAILIAGVPYRYLPIYQR